MIEIIKVESGRDLDAFIDFGISHYRGDRNYIYSSPQNAKRELKRALARFKSQAFLGYAKGSLSARAVAMISSELMDQHGLPYGMIGYFEAINDDFITAALFNSCKEWLRSNGVRSVIGPINGDTWHSYRLNAGPWDFPPFLLEPYNPPYYTTLWEKAGFELLERYFSKKVLDIRSAVQAYESNYIDASNNGVRFRQFDSAAWSSELGLIYMLTCRIFKDNFLYSLVSRDEFSELYSGAKSLIDPSLIWFSYAPSGEPSGFIFSLPDRSRAVRAMRGSSSILGKVRFFLNKRTRTVNLKTMGVLKEQRALGTAGALFHLAYKSALMRGYSEANMCLIRDGNPSGSYDGGDGTVFRFYNLYKTDL